MSYGEGFEWKEHCFVEFWSNSIDFDDIFKFEEFDVLIKSVYGSNYVFG